MGKTVSIKVSDGHTMDGYLARPEGTSKGAIVVVQEIFGVNSHIRAVCDRLAGLGHDALAPALFDRYERGFETGYQPDDIARARTLMEGADIPKMVTDTLAAIDDAAAYGPVAVMGFCLGGSLAFGAALQSDKLACAVGYYGGRIVAMADQAPKCPTMLHFGELDPMIPMSDVETIKAKRPDCEIFVYHADHGFNCDERGSYNEEAAKLAWSRSMAFIDKAFSGAKVA
jgi:carboxymethylenebutenolidase